MIEKHYARQKNKYYCGPAVMQIILRAHNVKRTQDELAKRAKTNKRVGTTPSNLVATLKKEGLTVSAAENQTPAKLRAALKSGKEVVVCITSEGEGHYVVVLALTATSVKILDPYNRSRTVIYKHPAFLKVWQDPVLTKTYHWAAYIG